MITAQTTQQPHAAQANLFKALAHPARLAILDVLRDGEECVCHLEAVLGYRQAYLSQQLAVLREAGVVAARREGWMIFYRVILPEVMLLLDAARAACRVESVDSSERRRMDACPCPKCSRT